MMKKFEERIIKDVNGFYKVQVRHMPLEEWEQGDGWGTIYTSSIFEHALERVNDKAKAFAEYLADKEASFTGERVRSIEDELFG